jgi:hypothetical protein
MKVDEQIFDSWSELALQDLLIDVAAAIDATECDRTSNGTSSVELSRKSSAESRTWSTAGII